MAYESKTDWLPDDPINEDDVNRWEKGIQDAHKDLSAHKIDMNNPHKVTKEQLDRCSTCDLHAKAANGLSAASSEQLRNRSGEEIVAEDVQAQMKRQ